MLGVNPLQLIQTDQWQHDLRDCHRLLHISRKQISVSFEVERNVYNCSGYCILIMNQMGLVWLIIINEKCHYEFIFFV